MELKLTRLEQYLATRHGRSIKIDDVRELGGESSGGDALKQFGYGRPLLVTYRVNGKRYQEVVHRIRRNAFGRERDDDRVAAVWLDYTAFNALPRHVPAVDMLVHAGDGALRSIGDADDLLLVTTFRPGALYAADLLRIRDEGDLGNGDVPRVEILADYLAGIHAVQHDDETLWRRRLRDLIGHGEGIMGLTDSYPAGLDYAPVALLRDIEEAANRWRWHLKPLAHRLSQVHGDFHPFNIVFNEANELIVLDRSRGPWGEPADDVSCLTINYIFFALQQKGQWQRPFRVLFERFWQRYLRQRHDDELVQVIQPWFAWRALVLASPLWYPTIDDAIRQQLINFALNVLHTTYFDPAEVAIYLEPPA